MAELIRVAVKQKMMADCDRERIRPLSGKLFPIHGYECCCAHIPLTSCLSWKQVFVIKRII